MLSNLTFWPLPICSLLPEAAFLRATYFQSSMPKSFDRLEKIATVSKQRDKTHQTGDIVATIVGYDLMLSYFVQKWEIDMPKSSQIKKATLMQKMMLWAIRWNGGADLLDKPTLAIVCWCPFYYNWKHWKTSLYSTNRWCVMVLYFHCRKAFVNNFRPRVQVALFVLCFRPSRPLCWTNITNCKSSMSRLCKAIDLLLEVGIRNWGKFIDDTSMIWH